MPEGLVGASYGPAPIETTAIYFSNRLAMFYDAKGLPPGLTVNKTTGVISGRPTAGKSTPYLVNLYAGNLIGTWVTTVDLMIHPLPDGSVGSFTGHVAREPTLNSDLGGRLDITTTAAGAFSGKLVNGATTHALTGKIECPEFDPLSTTAILPTGTATITRGKLPSLTLRFTIDAANNRLTAATLSDGTHTAGVAAWRDLKQPDTLTGYYTFGLNLAASNAALPQGTGYG
jgi:hypothetical protein